MKKVQQPWKKTVLGFICERKGTDIFWLAVVWKSFRSYLNGVGYISEKYNSGPFTQPQKLTDPKQRWTERIMILGENLIEDPRLWNFGLSPSSSSPKYAVGTTRKCYHITLYWCVKDGLVKVRAKIQLRMGWKTDVLYLAWLSMSCFSKKKGQNSQVSVIVQLVEVYFKRDLKVFFFLKSMYSLPTSSQLSTTLFWSHKIPR